MTDKNTQIVIWLAALSAAVIFCISAFRFELFPAKFIPLICGIAGCIVAIMGLWVFATDRHGLFKNIINIFLAAIMVISSIALTRTNTKIKAMFLTPELTSGVVVNVYTFSEEYRNSHPDRFTQGIEPTLERMSDKTFIIETFADKANTSNAIAEINKELDRTIDILEKEDVLSAVDALYNGEGNALIMNEAYAESVCSVEGYENFLDDMMVIYSYRGNSDVIAAPEKIAQDLEEPFVMFVGGIDTRDGVVKTYGRIDVEMLMSVNPNTKQIMIVSIPRDFYVANPALSSTYDKLTHLGNQGVTNTMAALSDMFETEIPYYAMTEFSSFQKIIDAIGGIDVDNPYEFTTAGSNGGGGATGWKTYGGNYVFEEGNIHLTGNMAIAYVRERYSLQHGDFDRNEHQMLVLKGILKKLMSVETLSKFDSVLSSLEGMWATNIDPSLICKMAADELSSMSGWDIITYHLGGEGQMQSTASMGSRHLYVVRPYQSQIDFIKGKIDVMMENNRIEQDALPDEDKTVYIPN